MMILHLHIDRYLHLISALWIKNEYLDEEILIGSSSKSCVIRGKLEKPEWSILSDSLKMIDNYTCLMAKGFVRGRSYTVWFTPDIPVSAGPWKLWGLPGLIVIARSDDGVVGEIGLVSLKQTGLAPKEPEVTETVSHEEFKIMFQASLTKLKRNLKALLTNEIREVEVSLFEIDHQDKSLTE